MYVDRDTRGKYSIMDLREGELMLIHEALCAYVQANMGNIGIYNAGRIRDFDQQIKRIKDGNEKEDGLPKKLPMSKQTSERRRLRIWRKNLAARPCQCDSSPSVKG